MVGVKVEVIEASVVGIMGVDVSCVVDEEGAVEEDCGCPDRD